MWKISFALSAFAAMCAPAMAADMSARPLPAKAPVAVIAYDPWNGLYLGVNAGYGFDLSGIQASQLPFFSGAELATAPQGFVGGIHGGYNFHLNQLLLLGLDANINGGALKGTASAPGFITGTSELNWFGSVGGRVGITPFQNVLIYGFGGLAFGDPSHTFTLSNFVNTGSVCTGQCTATDGGTKTGPAWGFGMEFVLDQHWKLGADWRRYDFGTSSLTMTPNGTTTVTFNPQNRFDVLSARLTYNF